MEKVRDASFQKEVHNDKIEKREDRILSANNGNNDQGKMKSF